MENDSKTNIFLTGFSGTGKTTVGREIALRLGWSFVDLDYEISSADGRSVPDIFNDDGEGKFRELERDMLSSICDSDFQVVATGGGIVSDESNRLLMSGSGVVVCLEASTKIISDRLTSQRKVTEDDEVLRPMLLGDNTTEQITSLKSERQPYYAMADWTVHTGNMSPSEVAMEVVRAWEILTQSGRGIAQNVEDGLVATVVTSSGSYPVWVGWDELRSVGSRLSRIGLPGAVYIISDEHVCKHARSVQSSVESVGVPAHLFLIPPGEGSKNLDMARRIYEWLADIRAERGHMILAVGGGVVGDLAGFVAATFLRGMPFGQVPTTILAMMDSAVGGKTGVDLTQGKNLVGVFHQPRFVLADVQTLQTMESREMRAGWAEAIKHGLILDEPLLGTFEDRLGDISALDRVASMDVITRSIKVKARVVTRDEKEVLGVRVLLNYGHTIGHAIESVTGYREFLHGEAVSIGMMGAAEISMRLGMMSSREVDRQRAVLSAYGLPVSWSELDSDAIIKAMAADKKMAGGVIKWVLLNGIGRAVTRSDVPENIILDAFGALRE